MYETTFEVKTYRLGQNRYEVAVQVGPQSAPTVLLQRRFVAQTWNNEGKAELFRHHCELAVMLACEAEDMPADIRKRLLQQEA